jgi:hypothetical protein
MLVDLGLRSVVPMSTRSQLFAVHVDIQNPREDGLFHHDEADMLFVIGDAIVDVAVRPQNQAIQAGKLTTAGKNFPIKS